MGAQRVMSHQLLRDLFREGRIESASDVNGHQFLVLALVVSLSSVRSSSSSALFRISL